MLFAFLWYTFTMKALTIRDETLLKLAANGASGQEIAEAVGMSPEAAILRIREIIQSRDVWDDVEREKLLLQSLYDLKGRMEKNLDNITGDPKMLDQYRKILESLGTQLDRRSRVNDSDLQKVTEAQARVLIQLVNAGYQSARKALAAEYPDVDLEVIDVKFSEGMEKASLEIEAE